MSNHEKKGPETATWINRFPKSAVRKVLGASGVPKPEQRPFQTHISASEIAGIEDEDLRQALERQRSAEERGDSMIPIPVAYMPERTLSHVVSIPRGPMVKRDSPDETQHTCED